MENLNILAVIAAAVSMFLIGGLWYSPAMFQRPWMRASGVTASDLQKGGMARIFGLSFLCALLMAANLAAFLADPSTTPTWGATAGLLAGLGWVALGIGVLALFERRPLGWFLINGGYFAVSFVVMGLILGAWR
jgi:hypothetical protein